MSNFLAIATVTETLRQLLDQTAQSAVAGASATTVRPAGAAGGAPVGTPNLGVNLFLYQVTPNAAWRNMDLPHRSSDGSVCGRPRVALDLHYLLTFYGQESKLEPQRLLGRIVQIRSTITSVAYLAASNLPDEIELVKFAPLPLSLEELSKLWSIFFQTTYTLSVAYQGTVVLIESDLEPRQALPVRERNLRVLPYRRPFIEEVTPQIVDPGGALTISGQNLGSDVVKVNIGDVSVTPTSVSDSQIKLTLPAGLLAGVTTAQVVQFLDFKTGAALEPHQLFESNVVPFTLAPGFKIASPAPPEPVLGTVARGAVLSAKVLPPVGRSQRVSLLVGDRSIALPPRKPTDPATSATLKFTIPADFPTGSALARLQVDGVQSALTFADPAGYTGPKVLVT
jgi:Pvc16 N-terminal domain/IPT/TIG domain